MIVLTEQELREMLARAFDRGHCTAPRCTARQNPYTKEKTSV